MKKYLLSPILVLAAVVILPASALAHVVVKPAEVGVGKFQTFTMGVPNEKENPTTKLRLVIPEGLNFVTPTVKPGWKITTKQTGEGEEAKVTEITWSGGQVPANFRDDFTFSAQAPENETTIAWKAYQTYADGETVAWEETPVENGGHDSKPYSETKVINDLAAAPADDKNKDKDDNKAELAKILSIIALVASAVAIVKTHRTRGVSKK